VTDRLRSRTGVREKAEGELKELAVITAYLFVVFAALLFYKSAILQARGIDWAPWSFALVKALFAAKFILVGRALHLGERHRSEPLIWPVLYKSLIFLVFVIVLTVIEDVVVGFIHGQEFASSIAEIGGGTLSQMIATIVLLFLVLLPLFIYGALDEVMGQKALLRIFLVERLEFEVVKRRS
jgi:hypothetical protein